MNSQFHDEMIYKLNSFSATSIQNSIIFNLDFHVVDIMEYGTLIYIFKSAIF